MPRSDALRRMYLDAMGIPVWVRREPAARHAAAAPAPLPGAAPESTETRAAAADEWASLRAQVEGCTACDLHRSRTQTVFGVGDVRARWLIIGEAPGVEEDKQGEPFVGRAGRLLNAMLAAVGLQRDDVYIANVLKCRPPGNRDPRPEEAAACARFLHSQVTMVAPAVIVAVGRIAAQHLLATAQPLGRLRGRVHAFGAAGTPVVVTYHPAYLLRSPLQKRRAWDDLVLARCVADGNT